MAMIAIRNADIITQNPGRPFLRNQAVLIENSKIICICDNNQFKEKADLEIDASGKILLPGLINAHAHFYSAFARGLTKSKPAENFKGKLENLWWKIDKLLENEDTYYSALAMLINSIKHGTTTIFDHHAGPNSINGSLDLIAKAVNECGLNSVLCYETSDRDGEKIRLEGLLENYRFIENLNKNPRDNLRGLFGLHASFTLEDSTLSEVSRMITELGTGVHIHAAEDKLDQKECKRKHGISVIERLEDFKLLGKKTILAHCVHVNEDELDLIRHFHTNVVHNPQSNANNGVGSADILKMTEMNIPVCLGTDSMTMNMLEEIRTGIWLQHHKSGQPDGAFLEMCHFLFQNNARLASKMFDRPIGQVCEGFAADLVLFDYYTPTPLTAENAYGHLVYGISQEMADTVICNGKILMQNKLLKLDIDEKEVMIKARERSQKLWNRM